MTANAGPLTTRGAQSPQTQTHADLAVEAVAPDLDITPEEIEAVVRSLRAKKASEAAARERVERQRATGYPKDLYNPKFKKEQVFRTLPRPDLKRPEGPTNAPVLKVYEFHGGKITVDNEDDEAFVKASCPGRIFEGDPTQEVQRCPHCGFATTSLAAYNVCITAHVV